MRHRYVQRIALIVILLCSFCLAADKPQLKTLKLFPKQLPVPALRYSLLPSLIDQTKGNAVIHYYMAVEYCHGPSDQEDWSKKVKEYLDLPLGQVSVQDMKKASDRFYVCFEMADLAAHRGHCDWDAPLEDGFGMRMPSLSDLRSIARAMALKLRVEILEGQYDQALKTLQTGLAMGQHIGRGPTAVHALIGVGICGTILGEVETWVQSPNAPNLYWALAALPEPMIDMRHAMEFERDVLYWQFPKLKTIKDTVLTSKEASDIIKYNMDFFHDEFVEMASWNNKLGPIGFVMAHYSDAKVFLTDHGISQEKLEAMPAAQAVLAYQLDQYLAIRDNAFKWTYLPYAQAHPYWEQAEKQPALEYTMGNKPNLFISHIGSIHRIRFLQTRLDRRILILQTIEAIRMYAAGHSGQLPKKLTDIKEVPIPADPVTGNPFVYTCKDGKSAHLEAPVSRGSNDNKRPVFILTSHNNQ
jgi:hypothetical protein